MDTIKTRYIEKISVNFRLLSELVLRQVAATRTMLEQSSDELYVEIGKNEILIDSLDVKVREEVLNCILLFSPKAMDLRKIMAYYDATKYLERVGDLILNVSGFLKKSDFNLPDFPEFKKKLASMLKLSDKMIQGAIYAVTFEDNSKAYETIASDDKLDNKLDEITEQLHLVFRDKLLSSQDLLNITSINSISYNVERIGDNATNIAEVAVYLTEGKDIRHGNG